MIYANTRIRFVLFSLSMALAMPSLLEAYPYAYRRLVRTQGKTKKVIELISDAPWPEVAMAHPSKFNLATMATELEQEMMKTLGDFPKLSKADQSELIAQKVMNLVKMGPGEKSFIEALRNLGDKKNKKIQCIAEGFNVTLGTQSNVQIGSNSMLSLCLPHLVPHEFNQSRNKSVIHVPSTINNLDQHYTPQEKILSQIKASNKSHIIVVAGADCCKELAALLIFENYKLEKSMGTEYDNSIYGLKFKWKVFHHTPLIALYRLFSAANRLDSKLKHLNETERKIETEKIFRAVIEKRKNPKKKIKVNKDAAIIFSTLEQVIRGLLYLHRDLTQMIPPLSAKTWKHLGA